MTINIKAAFYAIYYPHHDTICVLSVHPLNFSITITEQTIIFIFICIFDLYTMPEANKTDYSSKNLFNMLFLPLFSFCFTNRQWRHGYLHTCRLFGNNKHKFRQIRCLLPQSILKAAVKLYLKLSIYMGNKFSLCMMMTSYTESPVYYIIFMSVFASAYISPV